MDEGYSRIFLLLIFFALAIYLLPGFLNGNPGNELTRWATTVSLVENTTFDISAVEDLIGENDDVVKFQEHSYSKYPPGIAVLAAPIYAMSKVFIGEPSAGNLRTSWFLMRLCIGTLPLFLLAIWLYQKDIDAFSLATLLFATPLFIYSLSFSAQVLVAVLIYYIFRLLFDARKVDLPECLQAGFLSGFVILCEFTAVIPVIIFGIGLLFTERRSSSRRLFFYILGIIPFLILLSIYNFLHFDSIFPAYYLQAFSFGFPTPYNIFNALVSPSRGLFFFSPILIFSIFAFFSVREPGTLRQVIKGFAIILTVLFMCCYTATTTDWAFGGKYFVLILPLMLDSFFDGEIEEYPSIWRGFLFTASFLLCTIPALTFSIVSPKFSFPHNTFWQPILFDNLWFVSTLATVFGLQNNIWTILPAVLLLLLAMFFVWRNAKNPVVFAIGILSAFLVVGIYMFVPTFDNPTAQEQREAIVKTYQTTGE